jgi:hypothetical protein
MGSLGLGMTKSSADPSVSWLWDRCYKAQSARVPVKGYRVRSWTARHQHLILQTVEIGLKCLDKQKMQRKAYAELTVMAGDDVIDAGVFREKNVVYRARISLWACKCESSKSTMGEETMACAQEITPLAKRSH